MEEIVYIEEKNNIACVVCRKLAQNTFSTEEVDWPLCNEHFEKLYVIANINEYLNNLNTIRIMEWFTEPDPCCYSCAALGHRKKLDKVVQETYLFKIGFCSDCYKLLELKYRVDENNMNFSFNLKYK